jgi:hypothetical protein
VQPVIPSPDNAEIHIDPISINNNEYVGSSDDVEFDKASLPVPIVDKHLGQSGHEPRTPSDSHITSDVASDMDSAQRTDIDARHARIPETPRERETDLTIDDPTTSSSKIDTDPAKGSEPPSRIF